MDQLYADRLSTRTTLEQVARQQYHRYLPEALKSKPNVFIYAAPVGTPANLVTLQELREGQAYQRRQAGAPRWGSGHRLSNPFHWKGSPEAAQLDYPGNTREETEFRAVAYKHGAIAAWSVLMADGWSQPGGKDDFILPDAFMAALHGTVAPWLSFLGNLGVTTTVEGLVVLNNVAGLHPRLGVAFDPFDDLRSHQFENDPTPFTFSAVTTASADQIIDLCFRIFADMMYAAGHTTDFGKRDNPQFYSSQMEKGLLR
ncbi:MAG TPA: hypothetical protein VGK74_16830 [Symbiobacteriaceae bacterium]